MEEVLKFLGATTVSIAAVAWLIKQLTKHLLDKDIEEYRMTLKQDFEEKSINYREKIELYKDISQPIIELIVNIEHNKKITLELLKPFELRRLMITAQLAMFAPSYVFHSFNELIDYLNNSFEGKEQYSFERFREMSMQFLSNIRKDIGIQTDEIKYIGNR